MNGTEHTHLSQLAVERYLLGELVGAARTRIDDAISTCPTCRGRVDETAADDRAFVLRPVPAAIRALETEPARRPVRFWTSRWLFAVPAAAAAAVVAVVLWANGPPAGREAPGSELVPGIGARGADDAVRLKGSSASSASPAPLNLGFYVSRNGAESVGRPGERLTAGDRVQFWYDGPGVEAFALVGIDGRGVVTTYLPTPGAGARALPGGRGLSLGAAIELDDAKGLERFFLCAGPGAADPGAV
jgi:hypothetical protein